MNLVLYFVRRIRPGEEMKKRAAGGAGGGQSSAASTAGSKRSSKTGAGLANLLAHAGVGKGELSLKVPAATSPPGISGLASGTSSPRSTYTSSSDIARVCAFDSILRRFLDGPISSDKLSAQAALDDFRDCRLKIIPRIAAGPWLVRKGVGCTPAILGKKVEQKYYRNERKNYLEVVADVSSSMVAGRILALVKGAATALTIDLAFTLQGETPDELPESLLGGVRIMRCNLDNLLEIEEHERWLTNTWIPQEEAAGRW